MEYDEPKARSHEVFLVLKPLNAPSSHYDKHESNRREEWLVNSLLDNYYINTLTLCMYDLDQFVVSQLSVCQGRGYFLQKTAKIRHLGIFIIHVFTRVFVLPVCLIFNVLFLSLYWGDEFFEFLKTRLSEISVYSKINKTVAP